VEPPLARAVRPEVLLQTFGCRAQQADEEALRDALLGRGLPVLDERRADHAGIAVVHGCVVTARAERDARKAIRRLRREHPELRIVVTGCFARLAGEAASRELGADLVLPDAGPAEAARVIAERLASPGGPCALSAARLDPRSAARQRVPLRIQDGCDGRCAYCVVPRVRGRSRSVPGDELVRQVARLGEAGVPEVVLSGIQTGAWGRDLEPPAALPELLERLLALPVRPRLRISSVEPQHLTERLVDLVTAEAGICPHLHVPIQSGSPGLLARMGRPDLAPTLELLQRAWNRCPGLAVGFDVIAGLPTETERDHEATVALVERLPAAYLHVFTYSPRPGTPGAALVPQVPERFAVLRTRALLRSDERLRSAYKARAVALGRAEVAVEFIDPDGCGRGTTERFLPAVIVSRDARPGTLVRGITDGSDAEGAVRVLPDRAGKATG
jgi:threonylcarbamoyladenosine tRNA methylthiotransferase MtaB